MSKANRRKQRKEKKREQARKRTSDHRAFDNAKSDFRGALLRLYRHAKLEYASLIRVLEIDSELRIKDQEALDHCGVGKRYKTVFFENAAADGYSEFVPAYKGRGSMGGVTQLVSDLEGRRGTIVLMKRSVLSPDWSDMANISLFLHELGHVDDIHKGLHLVTDRPVDIAAVELYAHEFACRRLIAGRFLFPLKFYIDLAVEQLATANVKSISQAAQRFKESPLYKECRSVVGPSCATIS